MAQVTELSVMALPGPVHVFVAKTEAAAEAGPYQVAAGQIFVAGPVAGQAFLAGAVAGQVFTAGPVAGQIVA